jgi:hypothetical protein
MTLDDLSKALDKLRAGQTAGIHKEVYADLFPPGEPHHGARGRCLAFARIHQCRIDNTRAPGGDSIWFFKD